MPGHDIPAAIFYPLFSVSNILFVGAPRLDLDRFLPFFFFSLSTLIDYRKVFDISALQALFVPAVIVPIEIQVAAAFRAAARCAPSSHIFLLSKATLSFN
jgi:hypothetical protein